MATSGTYTFTLTISEFLDRCLALAGVVGEGEVANSAQYATALDSLNLTQGQLAVNDVPLWKRDLYEFVPATTSFVTHNSVQYRCLKGHTSASTDEPGVGNQWQIYWQEDDNSDASPSAWALSTAYTTSIEFTVPAKFYDILFASVVQSSGNETPMTIIPYENYHMDVNSKRTSVTSTIPTSIAFDNKEPTNTGFIFPQPTLSFDSVIRLFGIVKHEDSVNVGDNLDIPPRYINMLSYNVALDLAHIYQADSETLQLLRQQAGYFLDQYKKSNREFTSTRMTKGAF